MTCDMVDLPSSIPNKKGDYVYVFSPPEDNSKFLTQDMHVSGTAGAKATTSLEQSTTSTRSTNRQFPQGHGAHTGGSASDQNSITNKLIRSFRRSKSKSPQPEDSISSIPPNLRPSSPYLLNYSTNHSSSMEVSLDTFPSQTPQEGEEVDYSQTSATKRLLGLFQWRRRKHGSYTVDKASTLPAPEIRVQQQGADEHRDQLQTLSHSQSIQRHNQSLSRDFGAGLSNDSEHRVARSYRPSTFSGAESYAVSSSSTVVGGGPNVVTVEVEVHNVDESLELNFESPAHKSHHPSLPTNSFSINRSTESTDGEFLSLPEGTTPPSSKKSLSRSRRRILSFGTAKDAIQRKLQHQQQKRQKSHTVMHDRTHHLTVPLLGDHHRREEINSCSDSDEAGDSHYDNSRSSSVRTLESSFTAEDVPSQQSTTIADTGTAASNLATTTMVDCMADEFISKLEWNFKKDHLLREACTDLKEAVTDTIKQGQVRTFVVTVVSRARAHSLVNAYSLVNTHVDFHTPGKRPCRPKSQVMSKRPWAFTRNTIVYYYMYAGKHTRIGVACSLHVYNN